MEPRHAAEQLVTIRLLMERAALYRRALAPMMFAAGGLGLTAAVVGAGWKLNSPVAFTGWWLVAAVLTLGVVFLVVRRQSLRDAEPFWTPPTRRVFQALLPSLILGAAPSIPIVTGWGLPLPGAEPLAIYWIGIYGLGLNAAGFFMPRGIRWFGMGLVVIAALLWVAGSHWPRPWPVPFGAHGLMGLIFGFGHLAYGLYLRFTEQAPTPASPPRS